MESSKTDTIYSALRLQQTETMKDEYGVWFRDLQEIKTSWTSDTCRSTGGWRGYRDRSNNRTWSCDSSTHSTSWNHKNVMSSSLCVCVRDRGSDAWHFFSSVDLLYCPCMLHVLHSVCSVKFWFGVQSFQRRLCCRLWCACSFFPSLYVHEVKHISPSDTTAQNRSTFYSQTCRNLLSLSIFNWNEHNTMLMTQV